MLNCWLPEPVTGLGLNNHLPGNREASASGVLGFRSQTVIRVKIRSEALGKSKTSL